MRAAITTLQAMRRALPGLGASYGPRLSNAAASAALLFVAAIGAVSASHDRAYAQAQTGLEQIVKAPDIKSSEPMLLQADELIYENGNSRVTAKGNVEVYYGDYTLLAERIVYNRSTNTLAAEGKVPQDLLDRLPPAAAYERAVFPTLEEQSAMKEVITGGWDSVVGANVQ